MNDHRSPSEKLEAAIGALPDEGVSLAEVRTLIGADGLMLLTAFLTIVFLVPVSIPGVSTVFGAAILLIAISRLLRRELWLPRRIETRVVATDRLRGAMQRGLKWFRRIERVSRPHRMSWATAGGPVRFLNDLALILGALLLMAPFGPIPFSNTLPAIALLFVAIGLLQRDGVCIVLGHLSIVATIIYFTFLIGGGGLAVVSAFTRFAQ
ncbi:MAG TPA: exopolysaccharide biosynthesis protein [Thermoanaerobaculia bacterium]